MAQKERRQLRIQVFLFCISNLYPIKTKARDHVKKYEKYFMGINFTIYIDHKTFVNLFNTWQETSTAGAARIQGWPLYLINFDYQVV